ncbi:MAG TPA: hypothetical protein P5277_04260 [Candidatus Paceibacterota bacterium]|nr:hypothetical protein [Candidatus Paceibacterota bacterium]
MSRSKMEKKELEQKEVERELKKLIEFTFNLENEFHKLMMKY